MIVKELSEKLTVLGPWLEAADWNKKNATKNSITNKV